MCARVVLHLPSPPFSCSLPPLWSSYLLQFTLEAWLGSHPFNSHFSSSTPVCARLVSVQDALRACLCVISHPFPSFSLPRTVSDPSSSWKAHLPRELVQGSPLQIKKTVNRRHSKGEQGEGEVFGPQTPSRSVCSVAWSSKVSGTSQAHSAELFSIE